MEKAKKLVGRVAHSRARYALAPVAFVAYIVGAQGASYAAVDPSVSTAVTGGFTDMTSLLTGTLIPALFGLVVIGIAVRVGIKYLRRGSSS